MLKSKNMSFDRFKILVVLQVLLIVATVFLVFYTANMEYMLITNISLVLVIIIQTLVLINYVQKTNRDIVKFINEFQFEDSSIILKDNSKNKSFIELYDTLNNLYKRFKQIRFEKERDFYYFQNAFKHTSTALIAYNEAGEVEMINEKAKEILGIKSAKKITDLFSNHNEFYQLVQKIDLGKTQVLKYISRGKLSLLSVHTTGFKYKTKTIRLLSIQNIQNELEEKEIETYQKLIKILTHEISNSVSPINLVTSSMLQQLDEKAASNAEVNLSENELSDFNEALNAIRKRSRGLADFIEKYRELTQIPTPEIGDVNLKELVNEVIGISSQDLKEKKIKVLADLHPELILKVDKEMIIQVLINVLKNAMFALKGIENPEIIIGSKIVNSNIELSLSDNGSGISLEVMDHIFIPFFTTKENGSGIGLSLARQIMRLHGGSISVQSVPTQRTTVTLRF